MFFFVCTADSAREHILKSYNNFRDRSPLGHKLSSIDVNPIPHLHHEVTDPATVVEIIGDVQKEIARFGKPPMPTESLDIIFRRQCGSLKML